jgi:O-antigen/teichoic acid export membrane protein
MNIINKLKGYKNLAAPVKASLWYTVCNVLQKGMALLVTPIFTRILTQEQYGTYAVFQSWYSILVIFATLNLFMGAYDKGLILYEKDEPRFTSSQLGLVTTITLALGVVYLCAPDFWSGLLDLSPVLMLAMFIELLTMPAVSFWAARERFHYRYQRYVIVTLATTFFSALFGIITVLSTQFKVEARVFSDVLAKAAFGVVLYAVIMRRGKCCFDKKYWKYGLLFNLPLIPHFLSTFILNQADRIMIGNMVGNAEAAIYSVAYTISTLMVLIVNAINSALVPYIYRAIRDKEFFKLRTASSPLFLLVAVLCVLTMCFAPEIIFVFAGAEYADAIWVIPPVAASVFFIFVYSMFSTIEYYYEKTGFIAAASVGCAVLNLILNYVFINLCGYYAAGYTTLVCYMMFAVLHYVFYRRVIKTEEPGQKNLYDMKVILLSSAGVLAVMLFMVLTYRWMVVRYLMVGVLALVVLLSRKKLMGLLGSLK